MLPVHTMNNGGGAKYAPRFRNVPGYSILVLYSIQRSQNRRLQRGLGSLILRLGVAGVSGLKLNYSTLRVLAWSIGSKFQGLTSGLHNLPF